MPRYRPQLDSLRAFAALAILVSHFWISKSALAAPLGLLAVRLFFVLSGFLLTSILLAERDEAGRRGAPMRLVLGNFYVRRILRIWPAYYFAILAALLLGASGIAETFGWHALFASNILFFLQDSWHPEIASHLWTLGIEEQFYLVLPLVVLFVRRSLLRPLLVAGIAAAIAYRLAVALHVDESFSFYAVLPVAQLDALCGGALLAELLDSRGPVRWQRLAAWSLPAAVLLHLLPLPPLINNPLLPAAYVLPMVAIVAAARQGVGGIAGIVLGNKAVIALGRISYGVYLYHLFVLAAWVGVLKSLGFQAPVDGPMGFAILSSLTIAVAAASWFLLERPALSLRRRFQLDSGEPAIIPAAPTAA